MPLQQFIRREKSAGVVLGLSVVVAILLANSPWSEEYFHLFEHKVGFVFNGEPYLYYSLHHWINDGLMSMFFFVVGLELKREFIGGELANPGNTVLPIGAAVAGMLHDFCVYDFKDQLPEGEMHQAFYHPKAAAWASEEQFGIDEKVRGIILTHMFPLGPMPTCKEAWVVTCADKICASLELVHIPFALSWRQRVMIVPA